MLRIRNYILIVDKYSGCDEMKENILNYKKIIILVLMAIITLLCVNNFDVIINILLKIIDILYPFILGGVFAFILNIPMTKIEKLLNKKIKSKKITRILSITLSLLLVVAIIGFILFLLVPELVENIKLLIDNFPMLIEKIESYIVNLLDKYPEIQLKVSDMFNETSNTNTLITDILNYALNGIIEVISGLVSGVVTIFTAIIFTIYILSQKEYLKKGVKKITYAYLDQKKSNKLYEIYSLSYKTFSKFITGQCVEAAILGSIFFVVLSIGRFPYALLISVLTTVTALIPIFGAFIAMVVGVILIAINNPIQAVIFVIIFLIIQQIEGNFIYPKVVGASVGLSPIWTLLAITIGGSLFGIVGMIISLPLASILYALLRNDTNKRIKAKKVEVTS